MTLTSTRTTIRTRSLGRSCRPVADTGLFRRSLFRGLQHGDEACQPPNGCYELVFFDGFNDGIDAPGVTC